MQGWLAIVSTYLMNCWERLLFGFAGALLLALTLKNLMANNLTTGSAMFGMAIFCFIYSNLARFKKFKGLGFEAELWEDKQKEAADLIERLKSIVAVYTREIVMGSVMRGRLGPSSWKKHWELFDQLTGQHSKLGQEIDFSELKNEISRFLIADLCWAESDKLNEEIQKARQQANAVIEGKYGRVVSDLVGYNHDHEKLSIITFNRENFYARAKTGNLARELLNDAKVAQQLLKTSFNIIVTFDEEAVARLEIIAELIAKQPIIISPEMISWADERLDE